MQSKKLTRNGPTKMLCNKTTRQTTTVLDKNGKRISVKGEANAIWIEHSNPITYDQECDVHDTIEEIGVNEPTLCEYSKFDEDLKCAVEDIKQLDNWVRNRNK